MSVNLWGSHTFVHAVNWEHRARRELLWELGVGAEEEPGKIPFSLVCVLSPVGGPPTHPTCLERAEPWAGGE